MSLRCPSRTPSATRVLAAPATFLALVLTAGCGGDADAGSTLEVVRDTVADTLVVRTVAGSEWGAGATLVPEVTIGVMEGDEHYMFGTLRSMAVGPDGTIYVMDGQIPAVRVYDADGTYRTTLGRNGEGPGEFGQPDGGMAILSDGRLVVRDPGNARLQVFGPDGQAIDTWPVISGGFHTSTPLYMGPGDTLLTPVLMDAQADVSEWRSGLQRMSPVDGSIVDTLEVPDVGYEAPQIEARMVQGESQSVSINSVPFSPTEVWAYHPDGFFIHGVSTQYAFSLLREGSPLRIERVADPVPVAGGEKDEAEAEATRNMRFTDPNWRWNGPPIPDTKPPFSVILVGRDRRIWVQVPMPGIEGEDPTYDPTDPDALPDRWKAPVAFDVFEADGTYLGHVDTPMGFSLYPRPILDGDQVWAVTRDDFDVAQVVRFRLQRRGDAVAANGG